MNEYWNLFLATGMPEAWVMSRKMGDRPVTGEPLWPLAEAGDPVRPCAVEAAGNASHASHQEAISGEKPSVTA